MYQNMADISLGITSFTLGLGVEVNNIPQHLQNSFERQNAAS